MTIPAIIFKAFPETSHPGESEAWLKCFNAGLDGDEVDTLTTGWDPPRRTTRAAICLGGIGLVPLAVAMAMTIFYFALAGGLVQASFDMPIALVWSALFGLALAGVSLWWADYLTGGRSRAAQAWKRALGEAWTKHGSQVFVLKYLPRGVEDEVSEKLETLEDIRKGLNRLDPRGDELDVARYAMERFIEASDIPLLSRRAAAATHIRDRKVRQAAKEYAQAVKGQDHWRKNLDGAIDIAKELLADRRQARTDAEIIRLVHER